MTNKWLIVFGLMVFALYVSAQTDNPSGLYRLQKIVYDDGSEKVPTFEQYKYCSYTASLLVNVYFRSDESTSIVMLNNDEEPHLYTGRHARGVDGRGNQVFDSNADHFTLRWYTGNRSSMYFPPQSFVNEVYDSHIDVKPDIREIADMLEGNYKHNPKKKTPLLGCWRCLGDEKQVGGLGLTDWNAWDGMDTDEPAVSYMLFDDDHVLYMSFEPDNPRLETRGTLEPYTQKAKRLKTASGNYTIKWLNDHVIQLTLDEDSVHPKKEVWVRTSLPYQLNRIFRMK